MPKVNFTDALQTEYADLYNRCEVNESKFSAVDEIVDRILANQNRYEVVSAGTGAPWYFIAAVHNMESSQRFDRHLHNGDRLSARTVQVPAGRPINGEPPFTWEESAQDALSLRKIDQVDEWSVSRLLYELEGYNGWGYRLYHSHVKSPYLWSFSNHYSSGKYIADGTWSDTATSKQCGAAVIIRRLEERAEMNVLTDSTIQTPVLKYADQAIDRGADLQRFLNTFDNISLRVDGWPGERTSDAMKKVFGFYLNGDPRYQ